MNDAQNSNSIAISSWANLIGNDWELLVRNL